MVRVRKINVNDYLVNGKMIFVTGGKVMNETDLNSDELQAIESYLKSER